MTVLIIRSSTPDKRALRCLKVTVGGWQQGEAAAALRQRPETHDGKWPPREAAAARLQHRTDFSGGKDTTNKS